MLQLRFHGRGGQGVVTSAELLAVAAFIDGRHAQAFPSFGSERMGAPVQAFCRIDDAPIRAHEPVSRPDVLVIQDPTLLHHVDVFAGLAADGFVLLNSRHGAAPLGDAELPLPTGHVRAPGGAYAYAIDLDHCKGCGICAQECPSAAITMHPEVE